MRRLLSFLCMSLVLAGCAIGHLRDGAQINQVRYGMTQEEALRLLGKPDATEKFAASRTEAWDYQYQDAWGYLVLFSVIFGPDGRVVSKVERRLNDGGDHGTS